MSVLSANRERSECRRASYTPVQIDVLRWTGATSVDLFVSSDDGREPILFHRAGTDISADQLAELKGSGLENLLVRSGEFAALSGEVLGSLEAVLQADTIPAADRFAALQLAVAVETEKTLRAAGSDKFVQLADRVGSSLAGLVRTGPIAARHVSHRSARFLHVYARHQRGRLQRAFGR